MEKEFFEYEHSKWNSCLNKNDAPIESRWNQILSVCFIVVWLKRLLFLALMSNKPNPPSFFGRQTVFHATKADLFLRILPVNKKFLLMQ
jgi:hypothetical protein